MIEVFLLSFLSLFSFTGNELPGLSSQDSVQITRDEQYDGNSLWGLIDGGADVYLEYGFDKLRLQELNYHGENFRIEVYRMDTPEDAFGIYSVYTFTCQNPYGLYADHCKNAYQYQVMAGNYYINVMNETGTARASQLGNKIGNKLAAEVGNSTFVLPELFVSEALKEVKGKVKFMRGDLGLQNGFPAWTRRFAGIDSFRLYLLKGSYQDLPFKLADVKFDNEQDLRSFLNHSGIKVLPHNMETADLKGNTENRSFRLKIMPGNVMYYLEYDTTAGEKKLPDFWQ